MPCLLDLGARPEPALTISCNSIYPHSVHKLLGRSLFAKSAAGWPVLLQEVRFAPCVPLNVQAGGRDYVFRGTSDADAFDWAQVLQAAYLTE